MIPVFLALFSWPLVAAALFARFKMPLAVIATLLGGFLLLPERIALDLPLLPPLDKSTVPALAALALMTGFAAKNRDVPRLSGLWSGTPMAWVLLIGLVAGTFLTVLTNAEPLRYGPLVVPGLRIYDALSVVLSILLMVLPLVLGRKFLAHPAHQRLLLAALAITGAIYALPALFEVRMSPQLHIWFYGYFQHSWLQHIRWDGWRPAVFLPHGLVLSLFFALTSVAAFGAWRLGGPHRFKFLAMGGWLLVTLLLSKSIGALVIAMLLVPLVLLPVRAQLLAASIVCLVFISYPMLRGAQMVPVDWLLTRAEQIDPDRAHSLGVRIEHEENLLAKAAEKPVFGWGPWGRARIYDDQGVDTTISDGYWVIIIGLGGWVRYLMEFGLLVAPVFLLTLRRGIGAGLETSLLALILTGNLIDLIPNSGITVITWLLAGSLWGRLELGRIAEDAAAASPQERSAAALPRRAGGGYRRPAASGTAVTAAEAVPPPVEPATPRNAYTRQARRITRKRAGDTRR